MRYNYGYEEEDHRRSYSETHIWHRLLRYVKPHGRWIVVAVILSLLITATSLAVPHIIRLAIDDYITNDTLSIAHRCQGLSTLALILGAILTLEFCVNFVQVTLLEWTGQHIMHALRQQLFAHLLGQDLPFFAATPVGRLVTRLTNDIQNMHEMFTSVIVTIFNDGIRLTGILALLFFLDADLAWLMLLLAPLVLGATVWFSRLARRLFRTIRSRLAALNSHLQEILAGQTVIQLLQAESRTLAAFSDLNRAYCQGTIRQVTLFGIFMPFIELCNTTAVAVIIWFGGKEVLRDRMTLGALVAFLAYMRLFFQPLRELSQKYSLVQSALASAERIFTILDNPQRDVGPGNDRSPHTDIQGAIEFDKVSFSYRPGQRTLEEITFRINAGDTLAIVGATGAGKTTIINLLEKFYLPDHGTIAVDGVDITDLDTNWLRQQLGLVMQEVLILPATLRENISFGVDLSEEALAAIVQQAQLAELTASLPAGLETIIGEGGRSLSAGQQQLLAFARVLARDPKILLLDEATSLVDSRTEMLVEQAIAAILPNRTNIIIAHRLSTIQRADQILVLEQGRIVQQGTHAELYQRPGPYRRFLDLQRNGLPVTDGSGRNS